MKVIKQISSLISMLILMASFSQCSTAQKLQKKAPIQFGEVYCQNWIAGVQGGGSGLNLFIPTMDVSIVLDSVYFRGKVTKLEINPNNKQLYIGRFKSEINQPKDIILSSDPKEEYTNKMPIKEAKMPFELNDNECVVSYQKGEKTLYYKIPNVIQKEPLNYPSSRPNKQ
nr:hypothetical protein [uncultured Psychroserpens sp.]